MSSYKRLEAQRRIRVNVGVARNKLTRLRPLLRDFENDYAELVAEAESLGLIDEFVDALDRAGHLDLIGKVRNLYREVREHAFRKENQKEN